MTTRRTFIGGILAIGVGLLAKVPWGKVNTTPPPLSEFKLETIDGDYVLIKQENGLNMVWVGGCCRGWLAWKLDDPTPYVIVDPKFMDSRKFVSC